MMLPFDNYKFHCSSLGDIMTNPRSGPGLSETCKKHLLHCYVAEKYGRYKHDENKYILKGNMAEEDGISLYSRVTKTFYKKNEEVFENDYIIGTPDIIHGKVVTDIKSSWDLLTFYENIVKPMNKDYIHQLNGYMELIPGCKAAKLVYTLINTPDVLIEQEKSKLRYRMGLIDYESSPVYQEAVAQIEKNCIFDDIDIHDRYIEFDIPKIDMSKVYERVITCRGFMNAIELSRMKSKVTEIA